MNVSAIMTAARKHYKIMSNSCSCSVCDAIRAPKTIPDYEELISYNKSGKQDKPITIKMDREPRSPADVFRNPQIFSSPTKEYAQRGIYKPIPQPPKAIS